MAIKFLPKEMLQKIAPKRLVKKLVSDSLTINRATLVMLEKSGALSRPKLVNVAIKVIRDYKEAYRDEIAAGASKDAALDEAINDRRLLVQRVQNSVVHEIAKDIKKEYRGEFYEWLPSSADEPDPLHQLKYGKKYQLGKGEMPGDRYGCQCGMRILVDETRLSL